MPNWCNNKVTLSGSTEQVNHLLNYLKQEPKPDDYHGLLEYFVPQPQTGEDWGWYDWRVENWGTKWEPTLDTVERSGNTITIYFDSAWAPPTAAYDAMHAQGWDITALYFEPGMGFAGRYTNGYDDGFDITMQNYADILADYPDLDAAFNITETLDMYREEN
jgi:hypothetical protein